MVPNAGVSTCLTQVVLKFDPERELILAGANIFYVHRKINITTQPTLRKNLIKTITC